MEKELLSARIFDAIDISVKQNKYKSVGFLSEEEAALAFSVASNANARFVLYGGYDGALRTMFLALPDWAEDAENCDTIVPVTFSYRKIDKLSHRDFLGTLMALGITRETVGDILIEDGRAVAFLSKEIARYVTEQVSKVGGVGVVLSEGFTLPLPNVSKLVQFSGTVASARLDSVVSELAKTSREKAKALINEGLVICNSVVCEKVTSSVNGGDKISIRGFGRFVIDSCDEQTKKGRFILKYSKYI